MKKTLSHISLLAFMLLFFASCSKKVADTVVTDTTTTSAPAVNTQLIEALNKVNAQRTDLSQVSSHISLNLVMGSQSVKVSGELKMKRNSIIQVTLQALAGLLTVGRLEFTPDHMLVMDNMNKRFVQLPYDEIPFLKENGIDFYAFQALLWNEVFVPGTKDALPQASAFQYGQQGKDVVLSHKASNLLISFLTNAASGRLMQSTMKGAQAKRGMTCDYQEWTSIKSKSFPNKLQVKVELGAQSVTAKMDMSKLRTDDSWKGTPTTVDKRKYEELTLKQVWSAVMSLAN